MKKIVYVVLCVLLVFCFGACGKASDEISTHDVSSKMYTAEDIRAAIDTIKNEFEHDWSGCTLTEIYYAGDDSSREHQAWADRNGADEVLVLLSSFDVDATCGDGSLNANSTYSSWKWILVRTTGGAWQHVDHGY